MYPGILSKIRGLRQLRRALALVWESARGWTVAGLGLMIVQSFLPLLTLYLIKLTVDTVASGIQTPDKETALSRVIVLILITGLAALVTEACRSLAEIVKEYQTQMVTDHVMDVIQRQSAAMDLAYYDDPNYHDTLHRAQQEAIFRPTRIIQALTGLCRNGLTLAALAGLLLFLHWGVAVVLFVAVIPAIVVKIRHADRLYDWQSRRTRMERMAYEYHKILTSGSHAKELRLFDLGDVFRERYRGLRKKLRVEKLRLAKSRSLFDMIAQAGAILSLFGMLAFIAWRTILGVMTLGDMVMYYQAFQRAQSYLQEIMIGLAGLYEDSLFLKHFNCFLDLTPHVTTPPKTSPVPSRMQIGVDVENVSFVYPSRANYVLRDIRIKIRPGEVVALVGDNGSGKTTLAKLLCRLYDPTGGRILMDSVDFRDLNLTELRKKITMIFQDYIHYPLTVRENIWIGNVGLNPHDDKVREAAEHSGAHSMIAKLPKGYDTILGNRFEDGVELSVGEWQKVALARAFLRNAQLIILDEPTSSMSVRAEFEVFQSIRKLLDGRSALIISHRFSTVKMADMIYVLEDGMIPEQGSHDELMRLGGRYARLYKMQASHYN